MEDLSKLLEKIGEKYPDDKDVMAAIDAYSSEDIEGEDDFDMEFPEEGVSEEGAEGGSDPLGLEALLSEDLDAEEEEEDEEGVTPPTNTLGRI